MIPSNLTQLKTCPSCPFHCQRSPPATLRFASQRGVKCVSMAGVGRLAAWLCLCAREWLCVGPQAGYKLPLTGARTADSCISQNNLAHYDAGRLYKPAHFSSLCLKFQYPALFTRFPREQFTAPILQGERGAEMSPEGEQYLSLSLKKEKEKK